MTTIDSTPIEEPKTSRSFGRSESTSYDPGEIIDEEKIPNLIQPTDTPSPDPNAPTRSVTKTVAARAPIVNPKVRLDQQGEAGSKISSKTGVVANSGDRATLSEKPLQRPKTSQNEPVASPPPKPSTGDDDLDFLASDTRTVAKDADIEALVTAPQIKMAPRPPRFSTADRRPTPHSLIELEPSSELLQAYKEACVAAQASAVWVGGMGETLGDYVHELFRKNFPTRRYTRLPRLARFDSKVKFEYLWTGWGILYQGSVYLVLFEMDMTTPNPQPRSVFLIDPQTLF